MTYARNLERRKFGVYYFRQTLTVDNKQIVKRFSLKTKDTAIANFLAIQIKAKIEMVDLKNSKKFEISYDENNNIKSVKTLDDNDNKNLQEFLKLKEIHKAEEHKREIEKLKFKSELKEKEKKKFIESEQGKELSGLYEKLNSDLNKKSQVNKIESLKNLYIENGNVTEGSKYKYNNFISKLIIYAESQGIKTINKIDRKFTYAYLLAMRKDGKSDNTIKNIFYTLSTFYNYLITSGEINSSNPFIGFVGNILKVEESKRNPFTNDELENIFSSRKLKEDKKLFFICLLLLTTGARPNEICQLWTDDIDKIDDIYTIRITKNKERNQTLKTGVSDRLIYLNKILVEHGFIEYLKEKKVGMIFDLKKPTIKTYSTFVSEEFTEVLRELGIKTKTLYYFRHTTINRMAQNFVDEKINRDFVGHEGKTINEKKYTQKHIVENLKLKTEELLGYKEIKALKI